jgi:putative membrane protein
MTGTDVMTSWWLPVLVAVPLAIAYTSGLIGVARAEIPWPATRTLCASAGLAILAASLMPPLMGATDFRAQIVQHLLLAMLAPLALALSAPVTLALRTLPRVPRRRLVLVLHSRLVRALTSGPVVLTLEVGGMFAYYLTSLYAFSHAHPALHIVIHVHMFVAGCLLSWYLVGRDPLPRGSWSAKVTVLLIAAAGHDLLAKLMYADLLPHNAAEPDQLRAGAELMFYGGDGVEVVLAVLVMSSWYARTGRALAHQQRRAATEIVEQQNGSAR